MLRYEFIDPEEQIEHEDFEFVESFLKSTKRTQIGWHYITDITWMYSRIKMWPRDFHILDAGGGRGPVQFLLAELGMNVTNIDLVLPEPKIAQQKRYRTTLKTLPSLVQTGYAEHIKKQNQPRKGYIKSLIRNTKLAEMRRVARYSRRHERWRSSRALKRVPVGKIAWIAGNLCSMPEIPKNSFDAVVSLSALEHIPLEQLGNAVEMIGSVLKPEAKWAVTTSGTDQPNTWYHAPSKGLCFSEADLKKYFRADPLRMQDPSGVLEKYRNCEYLREHLAKFYFKSDKYGMPLGIWDPKYIPVGITM
jgi:2-polyprenyl-3-methyl-5-hydroxy-6-metoxy-1,4-benzoquinol methylase